MIHPLIMHSNLGQIMSINSWRQISIILYLSWLCRLVFVMPCYAQPEFGSDTISQGQQLRDWQLLRSGNNSRMQFFSPATSKNRYLGIFLSQDSYVQGKIPVWVANQNDTIHDASGTLMINGTNGDSYDQQPYPRHFGGDVILSTATSTTGYGNINTSATLQHDGNMLREVYPNGSISGSVLWESFEYPTDALLPGMKLGIDFKTGRQWLLTSWASDDVSSLGSFALGVDRNSTNQLIIWWHKNNHSTSGLLHDFGSENFRIYAAYSLNRTYISIENEKYFIHSGEDDPFFRTFHRTPDGKVVVGQNDQFVNCELSLKGHKSGCTNYSLPRCKNIENIFSDGGVIIPYSLPPSIREDYSNLSLTDCKAKCMQNCSCSAYASLNENGTSCEFWGEGIQLLFDSVVNSSPNIRIRSNARETKKWSVFVITAVCGTLILLFSIICIQRKCRLKVKRKEEEILMLHELVHSTTPTGKHMPGETSNEEKDKKMSQVYLFRFESIKMATSNFSMENKLGEGGFGPVYKGKLLDGQEIAVKKLSSSSSQGAVEFKNEIQLIVKLQHNNLVRLLGCCIHREQMMLVYEYMPNKSLDFFLFNPSKRESLKWSKRMNIIEGIAQGLLYLHKHSRLRVIHRDLKPSNILLDENMTPKISDFGMARIFGMQDSEANTKRIVGTHGYMSPEYAIKGIVSTKTDVFSFGVLVLEIVSGKKNHSSYHSERPLNLIGLAWELWDEGRALELVDNTMDVSDQLNEVKRCINVGLLCVQDSAINRPSMTDVIFMLKKESLQLPAPNKPAFFIDTSTVDKDTEEDLQKNCTNELSTSIMEAR